MNLSLVMRNVHRSLEMSNCLCNCVDLEKAKVKGPGTCYSAAYFESDSRPLYRFTGRPTISEIVYVGGPKKRSHSVLQKYCSDLHDFLQKSKSFNS